jgi:hypothetical protein
MSKENNKKPKADKIKPKITSTKAAQWTSKPSASPFAKKPGH